MSKEITIKIKRAPVVQWDNSVRAAYVRFSNSKVARTEQLVHGYRMINMDVDSAGEVVGLEFINVEEFGLSALLKRLKIKCVIPARLLQQTRYVPTEQLAA